ncbi:hypothetical protein ACVW1A_008081 [Bradyrhizobium sp. LB1.3]
MPRTSYHGRNFIGPNETGEDAQDRFARAGPVRDDRAKHIPVDLAGHRVGPHRSIGDRRRRLDPVRTGRTVRRYPAAACASLRRELSIRPRRRGHHHRGPSAVAVCGAPDPRTARASNGLSVHCRGGHMPCPHLPGTFLADGVAACRSADRGLALHDLARRLPALRAGLCLAEGGRRRRQDLRLGKQGDLRQRARRRCGLDRLDLDRHCPARSAAGPAARRPLHAAHDRRGVLRLVPELRRTGLAVVPASAFDHRRLAHGRDVRLAVRHRTVGDRQRRALRSRLLRWPLLRPLRSYLRACGASDRKCPPPGPHGGPGRQAAPAVSIGSRLLRQAPCPVRRRRRIRQ